MEAKFYKCPICGNVFAVIEDSGVVPVCCGKPMLHLNAMQTDGAAEKRASSYSPRRWQTQNHCQFSTPPHDPRASHLLRGCGIVLRPENHSPRPSQASRSRVLRLRRESEGSV